MSTGANVNAQLAFVVLDLFRASFFVFGWLFWKFEKCCSWEYRSEGLLGFMFSKLPFLITVVIRTWPITEKYKCQLWSTSILFTFCLSLNCILLRVHHLERARKGSYHIRSYCSKANLLYYLFMSMQFEWSDINYKKKVCLCLLFRQDLRRCNLKNFH